MMGGKSVPFSYEANFYCACNTKTKLHFSEADWGNCPDTTECTSCGCTAYRESYIAKDIQKRLEGLYLAQV